jgi:hypothetical protein
MLTCLPGSASVTLVNHCITSIQAPSTSRTAQECRVCGKGVPAELRQNHMGGHILRKLRGVQTDQETRERLDIVHTALQFITILQYSYNPLTRSRLTIHAGSVANQATTESATSEFKVAKPSQHALPRTVS